MERSIDLARPAWTPDPQHVKSTLMYRFAALASERSGRTLEDYDSLWRWSVEQRESFWSALWDFCGLKGSRGERVLLDGDRMPGAHWFPDATLNFAENLLNGGLGPDSVAVIFWGEDKVRRELSHRELRSHVAWMAAALRAQGVKKGDRVAAIMPNMPEALIALLAATSIGAIFTSTSPDFGVQGVLDRLGQIEPRVLFAVDGYWYNGKSIDCMAKLRDIVERLPSLELVVLTRYLDSTADSGSIRHGRLYEDFIAPYTSVEDIVFERLPFEHPVYILYTSGTTGIPKAIIHGAGGMLLQHMKEQQLHCDLRPGDRYFYFTTLGWAVWNILLSALASRATVVMYDGSPFVREGRILFDLAAAEGITHFGTSAKFIDATAKAGLRPRDTHDLSKLRVMLSTGSPLVPERYDYVYQAIKPDLQLSSMSGGTDICASFVIGAPTLPVWSGEIQCRALGMAVDVFDEAGRPVSGRKGELVCTRAFPSIPVGFWNDPDGRRLRGTYFERFANVWWHGDFCEVTSHGGMIIHGRSDTTLNPGGVRIGTAEIYRQVEKLPEILESLAIGQQWQNDVRVILFVRLAPGAVLDEALTDRIKKAIRDNTTSRHVPARVVAVTDIPRTKSGKLVELAVRAAVHGDPVRNTEALANPEALDQFRNRAELQS